MEDGSEPEIVNHGLDSLKDAWLVVQGSHEEYVKAAGFPDDEEVDDWIKEMEDVYQM